MAHTTLFLIRHGETEDAHEHRYKGTIDVPLSETGREQIRRVAGALGPFPLVSLYSSDLSRAKESAEILGAPRALAPTIIPEFRERHFGRWEGLTFAECRDRFPAEFDAWVADPLSAAPVEGETTREVAGRVVPALEKLLLRHRGEHFAIVSHGGVNRIVLSSVLGLPLRHIFRLEQDFAAVNIIEHSRGFSGIRLMNGIFWR